MSSDYQLEDTLYLPFSTRAFATGIPTALVSGVVDIYEDATATPIITGETLTVSLNSHAGFNMITVTATAATGFEAGKSYTAILDAGTVDSVSVIGEVIAHFTLDKSAAAKDLANVTDGLGALKTLIDVVNTDLSNGTDGLGALKTLIDTVNTDLSNGIDGLGALKILLDAIPTTAMRGTDGALTDKAGFSLSTAGILAIWHQLTSAIVTASTIGKLLKDNINATISSRHVSGAAVASVSGNVDGNVTGSVGSLAAQAKTDVNAEVVDALVTDTYAEPAIVPAATSSLKDKIGWNFALSRNDGLQTNTTKTLRNDADSADIASSEISSDGVTFRRNKWS